MFQMEWTSYVTWLRLTDHRNTEQGNPRVIICLFSVRLSLKENEIRESFRAV